MIFELPDRLLDGLFYTKGKETMKKFLMLLSILCCGAYADTITINWGIDNQPYTTTTCDIGNDVILPTAPTKRGHIFRGWNPEHFNRGTFANWDAVPIDINSYQEDSNGNKKPSMGDFIVIKNAYKYCSNNIENIIYVEPISNSIKVTYLNASNTYSLGNYNSESQRLRVADNQISVWSNNSTWWQYIYAETDGLVYAGKVYNTGDFMFSTIRPNAASAIYIDCPYTIPWRFKYDGVWEIDGKNGWKPVEQISNE